MARKLPRVSPPRPRPTEMLDVIDVADTRLQALMGNWSDAIPSAVRNEIRQIDVPLLRLLIRAGRR